MLHYSSNSNYKVVVEYLDGVWVLSSSVFAEFQLAILYFFVIVLNIADYFDEWKVIFFTMVVDLWHFVFMVNDKALVAKNELLKFSVEELLDLHKHLAQSFFSSDNSLLRNLHILIHESVGTSMVDKKLSGVFKANVLEARSIIFHELDIPVRVGD